LDLYGERSTWGSVPGLLEISSKIIFEVFARGGQDNPMREQRFRTEDISSLRLGDELNIGQYFHLP
jgi:hypothetical protein